MIKPDSLREHLTAALAEIRRDPDKLQVYIKSGKLVSTGAPSLSFEYQYTLSVLLTDYAGHPDSVMVPLIAWVALNQPELFANPDLQRAGLPFEADIIDKDLIDILIELPLTERVGVHARADGAGYDVEHYPEPQPEPGWPAAHWAIFLRDELIAEWDVPQ